MKNRQRQKDILFSVIVFCATFAVNLLIQRLFTTQTLVPMIFVFGVFLISLKTHGYCYGITSAIVSVFAVSFAFTYPYYVFDFFVEESILSAVIMLAVAVSTSTLNSRIRDQEKLRAESEKERMRGNLLRAISHDLRTPLTSIYGSSSTLISKYDALPKEQQLELLGEIQEDSEWLIRMVENLLSVTRIDGAKVEVVKTPTVLDELIDSVLMKFSKKHPNQKVITQIPEEFVDIPMDSLLIEQVLLNLLENAVDAVKDLLPENKPYVKMLTKVKNRKLLREISNPYSNGIQRREKVFYSTKHEGFGIGTASVAEVVQRMGGYVVFNTEEGIFKVNIFLPVKTVQ